MTNTQNIFIRKVLNTEVQELQEIAKTTFLETYSAYNTPSNMEKYLLENFSAEQVRSELENPNSHFYLAEIDGKIIGYIKLNQGEAQTETLLDNAIEIERIYISHGFQGKDFGKALLNKALEVARSKSAASVWLGVWDQNPRAIRFYKKNGFVPFGHHVFKLGDDEQTDIMMKFELN